MPRCNDFNDSRCCGCSNSCCPCCFNHCPPFPPTHPIHCVTGPTGPTGATGATGPTGTALASTGEFTPLNYNLALWTFDPQFAQSTASVPAGNLYVAGINVPTTETISNVVLSIPAATPGLTAGNFVGLYSAPIGLPGAGSLLASSADQTAAFSTAGLKTIPLTPSVALAAGTYYIAILANGAALPVSSSSTTALGASGQFPAGVGQFFIVPGSFATLPAILPSLATAAHAPGIFVGVV